MTSPGNAGEGNHSTRGPSGRPYTEIRDARSVSLLGAGMVVGAVIGAGVALLLAPQSGHETRRTLRRRAGRLGRKTSVWKKLGRELRKAARAKRKMMELDAGKAASAAMSVGSAATGQG